MNPSAAASDKEKNARGFSTVKTLVAAAENAGERVDRFLAAQLPEMSRTRIQALLERGRITINGAAAKRSHRMEEGDSVVIEIPAPEPSAARPEAIPLEILYSDADLAVINKPAGLIVHPGAGAKSGTIVNALLHEFGARGELSSIGGELRPGIVHRLDRETSGALLVARNDLAHRALVEQFSSHHIEKTYVALVHGNLKQDSGRIELPVARDLHRRIRMTTKRREGRAARTDWRVRLRIPGFTLAEADLHTGRTHQIRVHFSALGHPVVGDTLYGAPRVPRIGQKKIGEKTAPALERNFLHAARIKFQHPTTGKEIEVRAPLPNELAEYLRELAFISGAPRAAVDAALKPYL